MNRAAIGTVLLVGMSIPLFGQAPPEKSSSVRKIVEAISADRIRETVTRLAGFGTRHTLSDTASTVRGIGAARRWIRSEFERIAASSGGRMKVGEQRFISPASARIPHPTEIVNVIATLQPDGVPSETGKRTFILSGHYDSRASDALDATSDAPGADDDGSGVAVVLEVARVMSSVRCSATVIFAAFAGEEQGLFGSTYFADQAAKEGMKIEGVLNNDIVGNIHGGDGTIDSTTVRVFSEAYSPRDTGSVFRMRNGLGYENDGASRTLARYIADVAPEYLPTFQVKMVYRRDRFLRGGDQSPFHDKGFAAVRFSEMKENFDRQHQNVREENGRSYGDVPGWVDAHYCAEIARADAAALASLALAPPPPQRARILTKQLEYTTELEWAPVGSSDMAGYYVRYRKTTSPLWEGKEFTADTTISLRISKDDHIFGVQSVNQDGNASLEALPLPAR